MQSSRNSSHCLESNSTSNRKRMCRWHWKCCFMQERSGQSIREYHGGATWRRYADASKSITMLLVLQSTKHVVPFRTTFVHTPKWRSEAYEFLTLMSRSSSHCFIKPLRTVHWTWLCERPSTSRLVTISLLAYTVNAWPCSQDMRSPTYWNDVLIQWKMITRGYGLTCVNSDGDSSSRSVRANLLFSASEPVAISPTRSARCWIPLNVGIESHLLHENK